MLTKQEFSIRFLPVTQCYMPKVARALIRECREDIEIFGLEFAQRKWAKFVGINMKRPVARGRMLPQRKESRG